MNEEIKKPCRRCGIPKPLNEFRREARGKYGRASVCKECRHLQDAAYNARPNVKVKKRQWGQAHAEEHNRVSRLWSKNNRERHNETARKWRQANKEKVRASSKKWVQAHPDEARKYARLHQKEWIARSLEKFMARWAVNNAVALKKIPRASTLICSECRIRQANHYHHYKGYEKEHWLDVKPVCAQCHRDIHWD